MSRKADFDEKVDSLRIVLSTLLASDAVFEEYIDDIKNIDREEALLYYKKLEELFNDPLKKDISVLEFACGENFVWPLRSAILAAVSHKTLYYEMTDFNPSVMKHIKTIETIMESLRQECDIKFHIYMSEIDRLPQTRLGIESLDHNRKFDIIFAENPISENPWLFGCARKKPYAHSAAPEHTLQDSFNAFRLFFKETIRHILHDSVIISFLSSCFVIVREGLVSASEQESGSAGPVVR